MRSFVAGIALLGFSVAVSAGERIKPGLWEVVMDFDMTLPDYSASEKDGIRRSGLGVPTMAGSVMKQEFCVKKGETERSQFLNWGGSSSVCEIKDQTQKGDIYGANLVCKGPGIEGKGVMRITFVGRDSYRSSFEFKGTISGRDVTERREARGRWLGDECGLIRPVQ